MKIICVGRNYIKHIEELNNPLPDEPAIFMKPHSSLLAAGQPFVIPSFSGNIHHEMEIVLRIGKRGRNVSLKEALTYVDALTAGIDFTARDIQDTLKEKRLSWELSKAFDGAAAAGAFIPVKNTIDLENIDFELRINDEIRQKSNSRFMIFSFANIISFVSLFFTLDQGDLIYTGTPEGVAAVKSGDRLEGFINGQILLQLDVL